MLISAVLSSAMTETGRWFFRATAARAAWWAWSGAIRMRRHASDHVLSADKVALIKSWIDAGAQWRVMLV